MSSTKELTAEEFWNSAAPLKNIPDALREFHELKSKEESSKILEKQVENAEQNSKEFLEVVKPIIKWLCENHHPYTSIIVTPTSAELVEAKLGTGYIDEFIVD